MSYQRIHESWKRYLNEQGNLNEVIEQRAKNWTKYNDAARWAIDKGDTAAAEEQLVHLEIEAFIGSIAQLGMYSADGGSIIPNDDLWKLAPKMHEAGSQWCGVVTNYMKKLLHRIDINTSPGQGGRSVAGMGRQGWEASFKAIGLPGIPKEWTEDHCARVLQANTATSDMETINGYRKVIKDKSGGEGFARGGLAAVSSKRAPSEAPEGEL
tara:strand:- start:1017 stop:1649 length:633 start_codon:yes stop_codon:yes gene_type:complete